MICHTGVRRICDSHEEFFARVDKAEKEIAEGKGITFTNKDDMNAWLNSL